MIPVEFNDSRFRRVSSDFSPPPVPPCALRMTVTSFWRAFMSA